MIIHFFRNTRFRMLSYYDFQIVFDINPDFNFPSKNVILDILASDHEFEMLLISFGKYSSINRPTVNRVVISFVSQQYEMSFRILDVMFNLCKGKRFLFNF